MRTLYQPKIRTDPYSKNVIWYFYSSIKSETREEMKNKNENIKSFPSIHPWNVLKWLTGLQEQNWVHTTSLIQWNLIEIRWNPFKADIANFRTYIVYFQVLAASGSLKAETYYRRDHRLECAFVDHRTLLISTCTKITCHYTFDSCTFLYPQRDCVPPPPPPSMELFLVNP